jgi:hypothetical protein
MLVVAVKPPGSLRHISNGARPRLMRGIQENTVLNAAYFDDDYCLCRFGIYIHLHRRYCFALLFCCS